MFKKIHATEAHVDGNVVIVVPKFCWNFHDFNDKDRLLSGMDNPNLKCLILKQRKLEETFEYRRRIEEA